MQQAIHLGPRAGCELGVRPFNPDRMILRRSRLDPGTRVDDKSALTEAAHRSFDSTGPRLDQARDIVAVDRSCRAAVAMVKST